MKTNSNSPQSCLFLKYRRMAILLCLMIMTTSFQGIFAQLNPAVYTICVGEKQTGAVKIALPFKNGANIKNFIIETAASVRMAPNADDVYNITAENMKKLVGTFPDGIKNGKILFDLIAEDGTTALGEGEYDFTIVMESADRCLSDPLPFKVKVVKKPTLELMDPITVCQGSTGNVVVTAKSFTAGVGATLKYKWTAALSGNLTAEEKAKVIFGAGDEANVLTYPASGTNGMVSATVMNGNTFPVDLVYTVTPIAEYTQNGQIITSIGESRQVTVTVNPVVDLKIVPASLTQVICNQGTTSIELSTDNTGAGSNSYAWTIKTGTGTNILGCQNGTGEAITQQLSHSGMDTKTVTYVITHTYTNNGIGCTSDSKEVVVSVLPVVDIIPDKTEEIVCSDSTTKIVLTTNNEGADEHIYTWKLKEGSSLPGGVSIVPGNGVTENSGLYTGVVTNGSSSLAMKLVNTGTSPQDIVFTVSHAYKKSNSVCEGTVDVTFTVMPQINLTISGETTICSAGTTDLTMSTTNSGVGCHSKLMWKLKAASYPANVTLGDLPTGVSVDAGWYVSTESKLAMKLSNSGVEPVSVDYLVRHEFSKNGHTCYKEEVISITVLPTINIQFSTGNGTALVCSELEEVINFTTNPALAADKMGWSWRFDYQSNQLDVTGEGVTPDTPSEGYDAAVKGSGSSFKATLTNTPNNAPIGIMVKVTATYDGKCPVNKMLDITVNPKPVFELGE